jgi:hypothetical protein
MLAGKKLPEGYLAPVPYLDLGELENPPRSRTQKSKK